MFGFKSWTELSQPRDLEKIFEGPRIHGVAQLSRAARKAASSALSCRGSWRACLMGRQPSRSMNSLTRKRRSIKAARRAPWPHDDYCWMNAAYVMGAAPDRLVRGKRVLHRHPRRRERRQGREPADCTSSRPTTGTTTRKCPTEIAHHRPARARSCRNLGFLPLCHYKNTDYAVFFGGQTVQKPKTYDLPEATANAKISARLPYIMATSRFAHYLKVMARDKVGCFMEASDVREAGSIAGSATTSTATRRRAGDEGRASRCGRRGWR